MLTTIVCQSPRWYMWCCNRVAAYHTHCYQLIYNLIVCSITSLALDCNTTKLLQPVLCHPVERHPLSPQCNVTQWNVTHCRPSAMSPSGTSPIVTPVQCHPVEHHPLSPQCNVTQNHPTVIPVQCHPSVTPVQCYPLSQPYTTHCSVTAMDRPWQLQGPLTSQTNDNPVLETNLAVTNDLKCSQCEITPE